MIVTRRVEFDAGHRIPAHTSACRHLHGHRYALEATVSGRPVEDCGAPDEAMVADFGQLKAILHETIVAAWDHAFLAWRGDQAIRLVAEAIPDHRTVLFDAPPTAETLAREAFLRLEPVIANRYGGRVRLLRVRLYETPNCWADYDRPPG